MVGRRGETASRDKGGGGGKEGVQREELIQDG